MVNSINNTISYLRNKHYQFYLNPLENIGRKNAFKVIYILRSNIYIYIYILRLHLQYMEVPGLGVELELQLPSYGTACGNPGSLTH